ncbi:hypothetical protein SLA2020_231000 [Shorea laevis]
MSKHQLLLQWPVVLLLLLAALFPLSHAEVGTAGRYTPPYIPTACYGNDPSQLPSSNLFGAAGDGIWDNGAACGRQYLVRCISAAVPRFCKPGQTIQIKIVDRAETLASKPSREGVSIVLSSTAYGLIADASAASVNIEFQQ